MRFSLKSLLFMTIVVALCVALWTTAKSVRPLREQLIRTTDRLFIAQARIAELESKLGVFPKVDPKRIQAMRVGNPLSDLRRVRVYLPKEYKFYLHIAAGHIPVHGVHLASWRKTPRVGFSVSTSSVPAGEFTIDIQPLLVDGQWKLRITELADGRSHSEISLDQFSEWIGDRRAWDITSLNEALVRQDKGDPLILFRLHRGILKEFNGGFSRASLLGTADGVVVWIDQNPG